MIYFSYKHFVQTGKDSDDVRRQIIDTKRTNLTPERDRKKYLRKQFTQDFTALILAYTVFVKSNGMRTSAKRALDDLFLDRMCHHAEYFEKNDILMDAHRYCIDMVRCFFEK